MSKLIYNFAVVACGPWLVLYAMFRRLRRERPTEGWSDRAGYLPADLLRRCHGRPVIWVHAASVGETMAAKPLIQRLRQARPRAAIVLSHATRTGRQTAAGATVDGMFYIPFDFPWIMRRVFAQLRPKLFFTIDTELWPNLIWTARRAGCRVALCNGRISDRSFHEIRSLRAEWLYRAMLAEVDLLLMQSASDASRIGYLGGPAERIVNTGSLKLDEPFPTVDAARLDWWRETLGLGGDGPVLLAGSTGPGEEAMVLAAFGRLRAEHPGARLILVPRHIERADEIAREVTAAGYQPVRRTSLPAQAGFSREQRAVVIIDTIGELAELYAVGTVAFVGRSMVKLGGSNLLQAAAQGKPVLTGPYTNNFRDSVALLREAGVCHVVQDVEELAARMIELVADPARLEAIAAAAAAVIEANKGATDRTFERLLELYDDACR